MRHAGATIPSREIVGREHTLTPQKRPRLYMFNMTCIEYTLYAAARAACAGSVPCAMQRTPKQQPSNQGLPLDFLPGPRVPRPWASIARTFPARSTHSEKHMFGAPHP